MSAVRLSISLQEEQVELLRRLAGSNRRSLSSQAALLLEAALADGPPAPAATAVAEPAEMQEKRAKRAASAPVRELTAQAPQYVPEVSEIVATVPNVYVGRDLAGKLKPDPR